MPKGGNGREVHIRTLVLFEVVENLYCLYLGGMLPASEVNGLNKRRRRRRRRLTVLLVVPYLTLPEAYCLLKYSVIDRYLRTQVGMRLFGSRHQCHRPTALCSSSLSHTPRPTSSRDSRLISSHLISSHPVLFSVSLRDVRKSLQQRFCACGVSPGHWAGPLILKRKN